MKLSSHTIVQGYSRHRRRPLQDTSPLSDGDTHTETEGDAAGVHNICNIIQSTFCKNKTYVTVHSPPPPPLIKYWLQEVDKS